MNILLRREDNSRLWFAAVGIAAAAAGGLAWFFLRNRTSETMNEPAAPDYLMEKTAKKKKPKSDVEELHTIAPASEE